VHGEGGVGVTEASMSDWMIGAPGTFEVVIARPTITRHFGTAHRHEMAPS
jgi:hypothetical protein